MAIDGATWATVADGCFAAEASVAEIHRRLVGELVRGAPDARGRCRTALLLFNHSDVQVGAFDIFIAFASYVPIIYK